MTTEGRRFLILIKFIKRNKICAQERKRKRKNIPLSRLLDFHFASEKIHFSVIFIRI